MPSSYFGQRRAMSFQSPGLTSPQNWNQDDDYGQNWPLYLSFSEERVRTGPYGLFRPSTREMVIPRPRRFIRDSPPTIRSLGPTQREREDHFGPTHLGPTQREREDPGQTDNEFKKAMKNLRKEVYNPTYPRKKAWTRGLFSTKSSSTDITEHEEEDEDKSCSVCLEDFVPNERVLVTPCNHMFHNDCIVPWVRSHGKCPVCRFVLCEKTERVSSPSNDYYNNDGVVSEDDSAFDLVWLIRAMEEALNWINVSH